MIGETKDEILNSFKVKLEAEHGVKLKKVTFDFHFITGDNTVIITDITGKGFGSQLTKTESFFIKNLFLGKVKKEIKNNNSEFNSLNWVIIQLDCETNEIELLTEYIEHKGNINTHIVKF